MGEGSEAVVKLLLEAGADTMAATPDLRARIMKGRLALDLTGGRTALHLAAANAHADVVQVLVAAAPEAAACRDFDGATPREVSLREGARRGQLAPARLRIAEVLEPGGIIPSLEEIRAAAQCDLARQRGRCDEAEREQKALKRGGYGL